MSNIKKPTVLIVGAGLGGLLLGALLERAEISYTIFERALVVRPLGSGLIIGPNLMPLFEQLGIMEEFLTLGKATTECIISREKGGPLCTVSTLVHKELTGYYNYNIPRALLYDLLLKLVPPHKIHFGERVISITETDKKVRIHTSKRDIYDQKERTYEGDILVGADGAYSTVRQQLYERLKKEAKLPVTDQEDLPFHSTCLVGQTRPIDMDVFPEFQQPLCPFYNTMAANEPFTWIIGATAQKTITWMVIHNLDSVSSKAAEQERAWNGENSEWGPVAAKAMIEQTRHYPLPIGTRKMTMGDIYDATPKELISKVMLEEKVFETWYSGRTVLLGDACHKLNPSGAHGAVTSMHDALALANLIYALPSNPTSNDITQAFSEYQTERIPHVMESFENSQLLSKFMNRNITGWVAFFLMKGLPGWVFRITKRKMVQNRPTAGWLQEVDVRGTVAPDVSPSTEKARAVFWERQQGGFK
ncbi:hypothetical protein BKA57DRAFT_500435 [Linnemannia elongata]|nr:hypothetical protein BKA57DRAFT_500435 [Linnemannia elongata]